MKHIIAFLNWFHVEGICTLKLYFLAQRTDYITVSYNSKKLSCVDQYV